jgi:hypothetical protein
MKSSQAGPLASLESLRRSVLLLSAFVSFLPATAPLAAPNATLVWESGFENGFPGTEWLGYDNGSYTEDGTPNAGTQEAWTIVDGSRFGDIPAGDHVYKGWVFAEKTESHRPYPGIHCDIPSPLVNSFLVYQEANYDELDASEWIHFATWGNNPDWYVHTMSVRDRKVEMAHLDWTYIGPTPQPDFPLEQWVRFTAYIDYTDNGYIRVWQDGVPIFEGNYTTRSGDNLMRAHWGLYCSGSIDNATQYNDEIKIWTLDSRLTDLETEPIHGWSATAVAPVVRPGRRHRSAGGVPGTALLGNTGHLHLLNGRRVSPHRYEGPRPVVSGVCTDNVLTIMMH